MHKQKSTIQEEHNMQIAKAKLLTPIAANGRNFTS
jgi:hypothetical protein